ncbi:MAG TPA: hypothetical protein VN420_04740 [Candidatus Fimivivens sp.]|nr:hypothetical protein [Candidatus Fimivivens sp.]
MTDHKPAFQEDSAQSLFDALRERVRDEDIKTYGEYRQLVQDIIQEQLSEGALDVNEDLDTLESDLDSRWHEIEATLVR